MTTKMFWSEFKPISRIFNDVWLTTGAYVNDKVADRLVFSDSFCPVTLCLISIPEVIGISAKITSASPFWSIPVIPLNVPFECTSWNLIISYASDNLILVTFSVTNIDFSYRSKYILIFIIKFNKLISEIQKQFQFFY